MALAEVKAGTEGKGWGICRLPFFGGGGGGDGGSSSNSSSTFILTHSHHYRSSGQGQTGQVEGGAAAAQAGRRSSGATSVSSVARSLLPTRRRLRLDPPTKLYFPYEPGKQVRSAVRIKNTSKSHVAFKLISRMYFLKKTSTPVAVFKFVEQPENNEKPMDQKSKVKFKIVSLKVNGPMEYVPELFDEQKDQVAVEQILRVVFLDPDHPCPQMEKLKRQLAEAEAALEARKKLPEDTGPRIVGEGLVIDEWKERRERYLAQQQQVEGVDSV
ncbi:vesicle-associated protein 4-2-like isoform X2 [Musa acuminata AAA Group]|uniref:vesicle-associated protein 4-2-like isoform X2 n=1 Tax=Musa acuminata AAA Group TaxID=214697 RepID=UPI0031CE7774